MTSKTSILSSIGDILLSMHRSLKRLEVIAQHDTVPKVVVRSVAPSHGVHTQVHERLFQIVLTEMRISESDEMGRFPGY